MIRRAISPRLATRTRLMVVMTPSSPPATRYLARYVERRHGLAQRGRRARRPGVGRERGLRPGVVAVERHPQRPEHEVARRDPRALPLRSGHPHERPGLPPDARPRFGRALEGHAHAHPPSPRPLADPALVPAPPPPRRTRALSPAVVEPSGPASAAARAKASSAVSSTARVQTLSSLARWVAPCASAPSPR